MKTVRIGLAHLSQAEILVQKVSAVHSERSQHLAVFAGEARLAQAIKVLMLGAIVGRSDKNRLACRVVLAQVFLVLARV